MWKNVNITNFIKTKNLKLKIILWFLISLLVYTRFVGLDWGFPYPMHPDERNMAVSLQQLGCAGKFSIECLNPHFFAYGQFPLYLGFFLLNVWRFGSGSVNDITFLQAAMVLRIISAVFSIATIFITYFLYRLLRKKPSLVIKVFFYLLFTFSPVLIQSAHFGTTESMLMFFFMSLLYVAVLFIKENLKPKRFIFFSGLLLGLALGTKVSALVFATIPFFTVILVAFKDLNRSLLKSLFWSIRLSAIAFVIFIISSPYNFIEFGDFIGALNYESAVGFGDYRAFYTRQFEYSLPVIFQLWNIFPYALGWGVFIFTVIGLIVLPWNRSTSLLRWSLITFFLSSAFFYAKWTRFLAPIYPLMILFTLLVFENIYFSLKKRMSQKYSVGIIGILVAICILPGIAYLSIYQQEDVRFTASKWIYENIPPSSYILSETANVVDIPMTPPDYEGQTQFYEVISFNSYDLDSSIFLPRDLAEHIENAEYIFIPSRRVFWNHTCYREMQNENFKVQREVGYEDVRCQNFEERYPKLNEYYRQLFSGELGFEKVAEFHSYPQISFLGKTIIEFPDEEAEETWTVFDHPVIRIYKKI